MPAIEVEGHSEATFALVDGKIVRIGAHAPPQAPPVGGPAVPSFDARLRD